MACLPASPAFHAEGGGGRVRGHQAWALLRLFSRNCGALPQAKAFRRGRLLVPSSSLSQAPSLLPEPCRRHSPLASNHLPALWNGMALTPSRRHLSRYCAHCWRLPSLCAIPAARFMRGRVEGKTPSANYLVKTWRETIQAAGWIGETRRNAGFCCAFMRGAWFSRAFIYFRWCCALVCGDGGRGAKTSAVPPR